MSQKEFDKLVLEKAIELLREFFQEFAQKESAQNSRIADIRRRWEERKAEEKKSTCSHCHLVKPDVKERDGAMSCRSCHRELKDGTETGTDDPVPAFPHEEEDS